MEVRVSSLKLTLSSKKTVIREVEQQIASKNSKLDAASSEVESTERRLRLPWRRLASCRIRFKVKGFSFARQKRHVSLQKRTSSCRVQRPIEYCVRMGFAGLSLPDNPLFRGAGRQSR